MKKLILGATLLAAASSPALAAKYGPAGCGLGSMVFSDASSLPEHVLAATTNGTSGNQTFGMTSGTSGCDSSDSAMAGAQTYMDQNMEQLAADAARGHGEALDAFIAILKIEANDQAAFSSALQQNFDSIFAGVDSTSSEAFDALVETMSKNQSLAKYIG